MKAGYQELLTEFFERPADALEKRKPQQLQSLLRVTIWRWHASARSEPEDLLGQVFGNSRCLHMPAICCCNRLPSRCLCPELPSGSTPGQCRMLLNGQSTGTFCSHISTMLSDPDGLLGGACARDLNGTGDGRSSLCVLGCPGAAKTFALWCSLLCLDAALDHRVLWTSQQHSGSLRWWASPRTSSRMPPRWLQRLLWGRASHNAQPRCLCCGSGIRGHRRAPGSHHCQEHAPRSPSSGRAPVRQECTHARPDASFLHAYCFGSGSRCA